MSSKAVNSASPELQDPLDILQALIQCPSITPLDAGALDFLERWLKVRGFTTYRLPFGMDSDTPSDNIFAILGDKGPHFCFAGHTDVVPPGQESAWAHPPFSGFKDEEHVWGRGAVDMKGGIAAFMAATDRLLTQWDDRIPGQISFLITGDEEGPAIHGTKAVVDWMLDQKILPDACLVGEPTNPSHMTNMIKIGRRGSLTFDLEALGKQGHAAYPHLANNPVHALLALGHKLAEHVFDEGTEHFPATNLEVITFDVGNPTANIIPAKASLKANIRFNNLHTQASLEDWLNRQISAIEDAHGVNIKRRYDCSGDAFLFDPKAFGTLIADVVETELGTRPEYSTTGGTSDARFIRHICPVAEYGLVGQSMHKVDERASIKDLYKLTDIYEKLVLRFMSHDKVSIIGPSASSEP